MQSNAPSGSESGCVRSAISVACSLCAATSTHAYERAPRSKRFDVARVLDLEHVAGDVRRACACQEALDVVAVDRLAAVEPPHAADRLQPPQRAPRDLARARAGLAGGAAAAPAPRVGARLLERLLEPAAMALQPRDRGAPWLAVELRARRRVARQQRLQRGDPLADRAPARRRACAAYAVGVLLQHRLEDAHVVARPAPLARHRAGADAVAEQRLGHDLAAVPSLDEVDRERPVLVAVRAPGARRSRRSPAARRGAPARPCRRCPPPAARGSRSAPAARRTVWRRRRSASSWRTRATSSASSRPIVASQEARLEQVVGVEERDEAPARLLQPGVARAGEAAVRGADDARARPPVGRRAGAA